MVKLGGKVVDDEMTDTDVSLKEQEVTKKQLSTDEAPSDGTVAENQGTSHKHTVFKNDKELWNW